MDDALVHPHAILGIGLHNRLSALVLDSTVQREALPAADTTCCNLIDAYSIECPRSHNLTCECDIERGCSRYQMACAVRGLYESL